MDKHVLVLIAAVTVCLLPFTPAPASVSEAYRWHIVGRISLIFVDTLLSLGLLWRWVRHRKVEAELAITSECLRLTIEASKPSGWDWDIKSGRVRGFGDLQSTNGIPSYTFLGNAADFCHRAYPEDLELVRNALDGAKQKQKPSQMEFCVRRDGIVSATAGL